MSEPPFETHVLFDEDYNVLDARAQVAPNVTFTRQKMSFETLEIKEEGYMFVYLSYDNDSNVPVYFDDFKVTHSETNVIQYNEYYPFGLQTAESWTREGSSNRFLYNNASELNEMSGWYETFYRGYDPVLGRFLQIDPLAEAFGSMTPFNYANNEPVFWNDPNGDCTKCGGVGAVVTKNPMMYLDPVAAQEWNMWAYDSPDGGSIFAKLGPGDGRNGASPEYHNGVLGYWTVEKSFVTPYRINGEILYLKTLQLHATFHPLEGQQGGYKLLPAGFGYGEGLGSAELLLAGLKPTFDRAAHFARSQGKVGQVPLYLIKNVFKSPLLDNNKALYIGRVSSSTALSTANALSKLAPALTGLGVLTNGYDIIKDGQHTAGDGFQAFNTGLMIAFPVYGVIYGAVDLGFGLFSDQTLTDRIKYGIDSNVSGSIGIPKF